MDLPTQMQASNVEPGAQPVRRSVISLRSNIFLLTLICVVPTALFAAFLIWSNYEVNKERAYSDSVILARKVSADLDQYFAGLESGLRVLATSEELATGDLRAFHARAVQALKAQGSFNYILTDEQGRQLVNTLIPFGQPLPQSGTPAKLNQVFQQGRTVVTDLFIGPVAKRPGIAMGVPVHVKGAVVYSLNVGIDPKVFDAMVKTPANTENWLIAVLDSSATIVARSRTPELFVGQKAVKAVADSIAEKKEASMETVTKEGTPVVSSHYRSDLWGWTVAVGLPTADLKRELNLHLLFLALALLALLALVVVANYFASRRLLMIAGDINRAALAISNGSPVDPLRLQIQEFEGVDEALLKAAGVMQEMKHLAQHDPLTALANRRLFFELARNQLAAAARLKGCFALLAIDLDNFKAVNDIEGHGVGDSVLKEVAMRLIDNIREADLSARFGGDEFFLLLPGADAPVAAEFANRLVAALSKPYADSRVGVSASIGIAIYPACGLAIEPLIQVADHALNEAKKLGKACFTLGQANPLPPADAP